MSGIVPIADVTRAISDIEEARNAGIGFANSMLSQVSTFSNALAQQAELVTQSVGSVSIDISVPPISSLREPPEPVLFTPNPLVLPEKPEPPQDTEYPPALIKFADMRANAKEEQSLDDQLANGAITDQQHKESVASLYGGAGGRNQHVVVLPNAPGTTMPQAPNGPGPFEALPPGAPPGINIPVGPTEPTLESVNRPELLVIDTNTLPQPRNLNEVIADVNAAVIQAAQGADRLPLSPASITTYTPNESLASIFQEQIVYLEERVNSGTGIAPQVENAIWTREADRERSLMRGAETDALRMDAALGFYAPSGAAQAKLLKVRSDFGSKMASLGRDIAIKQAELELANTQKSLEQIIQLQQLLTQHDMEFQRLSLDAVRQANEAAVQMFDITVKAFVAQQEANKATAEIYKIGMQAAEAENHVYQSRIDVERMKVEVNKASIEQYVADMNVNNIKLSMYKIGTDAAVAKGQLEALKLKEFEARVAIFEAQTKQYLAQVQGSLALAQIYGEQVKAYQAQWQAYATEVSASKAEYEASAEAFKMSQEAWKIKFDAYKAEVDAEVAKAKVETEYAGLNNQANSVYSEAIASFNAVNSKVWEANAQAHISAQTAAAQVSKMNLDAVQASKGMAQAASEAAMKVFAQLVSAALSQQHYSTSASGSSSMGASLSESYSFSGE